MSGPWQGTFLKLYVPAMEQPFGDFRVVTAAVISADRGRDPLVHNPADHRGRALNYPRIWIPIGRAFPGEGGVIAAGFLLAVAFSAAAAWFVATQRSTSGAVVSCLVALSSSTWLALERGNTDLLIFALVALGVVASWRYRAVFLALAAVLKVYPFAAVVARAVLERRVINFVLAGAVAIYLAAIASDLALISKSTEVSGFLSFGMPSVIILLSSMQPPIGPTAAHIAFWGGGLLAAGLAFFLPLRSKPTAFETEAALAGGSLLLLCYISASNWDYRLIFALFILPYLMRPAERGERILGWLSAIAIVTACNYWALQQSFADVGVIVNLAAKYVFYCIVVFSLVRIVLADETVRRLLSNKAGGI